MRYQLTPEIEKRILAGIRQGAYTAIAVEAAGIPRRVFRQWLRSGEEPFRELRDKVREARAQARMWAEIAVAEKDPRFWLRYGPGREKPGSPGWSAPVKATVKNQRNAPNILLTKEWKGILSGFV